jgi:peptidoglycan biosynthesis protein MviN/MurJ (putative lipid II flippase)
LALGTSLAAWLNAGLLARSLRRRIGSLPPGTIGPSTLRTLAASASLGLGCVLGLRIAGVLPAPEPLSRVLSVGLAMLLGVAALIATGKALHHQELDEVLAALRGRKAAG